MLGQHDADGPHQPEGFGRQILNHGGNCRPYLIGLINLFGQGRAGITRKKRQLEFENMSEYRPDEILLHLAGILSGQIVGQ